MATQYIEKFTNVSSIPSSTNSATGIGVVGDNLYVGGARVAQEGVFGDHWYIAQSDYSGADTNDGKSFDKPFATWTKVFDKIGRGDVIHLYGNVASKAAGETTPQGATDVTVIGHGTRPRNGHTSIPLGPKGGAAEWAANSSATGPNLDVTQQGWKFHNIFFNGHADYPIVKFTNDTTGTLTVTSKNPSHPEFVGCTFAGPSTYGIQASGGVANMGIYGCTFYGFETAGNVAIGTIVGAGAGQNIMWQIYNNRFMSNVNDIKANLFNAEIVGNHFHLISDIITAGFTNTVAIDATGGVVGQGLRNWVALNHMYGAQNHNGVNARFVPGSGDMFAENYWSDIAEYGEPAS